MAGRHTAIVSADEHGLAFYHSLGKVLFVEASDILRILGKYQLDEPPVTLRKRTRYTILAMSPLPLGTESHPTDPYNVIALLTPTKLVIVGLKPSPRTWFKCPRSEIDGPATSKSRRGTLSWFPSVSLSPSDLAISVSTHKSNGKQKPLLSTPKLAFTWGNHLHFIEVFETKTKQMAKNSRTGKQHEVDVGVITYKSTGKWDAEEDILALQWLNVNVRSYSIPPLV